MVSTGKEISADNINKIVMLYGRVRELDNTTGAIKTRDKYIY